jgi:hypothetical protein
MQPEGIDNHKPPATLPEEPLAPLEFLKNDQMNTQAVEGNRPTLPIRIQKKIANLTTQTRKERTQLACTTDSGR